MTANTDTYCRGDWLFLNRITRQAKTFLELVADDLDKGIYPSDQIAGDAKEIEALLARIKSAIASDRKREAA